MSSSIDPSSQAGTVAFGTNRRIEERSRANIRAMLRFPDSLRVLQGSVCDISSGGAGFVCQQDVAPTTKCLLQFELPSHNHKSAAVAVSLAALVVNVVRFPAQPHTFRVNLRFVALPANMRSLIETHVRLSAHKG